MPWRPPACSRGSIIQARQILLLGLGNRARHCHANYLQLLLGVLLFGRWPLLHSSSIELAGLLSHMLLLSPAVVSIWQAVRQVAAELTIEGRGLIAVALACKHRLGLSTNLTPVQKVPKHGGERLR